MKTNFPIEPAVARPVASPINQNAARGAADIEREGGRLTVLSPLFKITETITNGSSIYKEGAGAKRSWKACERGRAEEVWETMMGRHGGNTRPGKPQEIRKERLAGTIKSW
ncbi:hypothetical protein NPIL_491081 [Nephila pilipes]|uniref:Uncharacterized protein n=1 Tax=Nephila pilipes TaxID=299642 RepID=A0A8X6NA56_NEPPI|nr:hypothetical protein NPIL_491081 [Nephila pilipes]